MNRRTKKSTAAELDRLGYRLLDRDPYASDRWHVAQWLGRPGSGRGSVTIGHASTLADCVTLAASHLLGEMERW